MTIDAKLIEFALWAIRQQREHCMDLDGGDVQDKLEELGLLERVTVAESCGDHCRCAEYGDFPQDCLRLADGVQA